MLRPTDHPAARHVAGLSVALAAAAAAIAALLTGGCGSDKKPSSPEATDSGTTSFTGVFANPFEYGKLSATVATTSMPRAHPPLARVHLGSRAGAAFFEATGSLACSTSTYALKGNYDSATGRVNLAGGGYTFQGLVDVSFARTVLSGTYSGPTGVGLFACGLPLDSVQFYCGGYQKKSGLESGRIHLAICDTSIVGIITPSGAGTARLFEGGLSYWRQITIGALVPGEYHLTGSGELDPTYPFVHGAWADTSFVTQYADSASFGAWSCFRDPEIP